MGEFNPGFAAAVAGEHRQFEVSRKSGHTDGEGEDVLRLAPFKALRQHVIAPDVLAAQALDGGEGVQLPPRDHLRAQLQPQHFGWREVRSDFVVTRLCCGQNGLTLLVKERREEQEARVFGLEAAASLRNAALAQDEDLVSAPERVHHDRPLFECRSHEGRIGR